jgi:hypothetical protein
MVVRARSKTWNPHDFLSGDEFAANKDSKMGIGGPSQIYQKKDAPSTQTR